MPDWIILFSVSVATAGVLGGVLYVFRGSLVRAMRETLKDETDRLVRDRENEREVLDAKLETNKADLEHKKETVASLVAQIRTELNESRSRLEQSERDSSTQFSKLETVLKTHGEQTAQLRDTTENLKKVLSDNRLRGQWGEEVAENLLQSVGFVKGQTYTANRALATTGTRPDFTILLSDGTKVNIDVKFPYDALIRYQEADTDTDRNKYLSEFRVAVRGKIKEVTSRGYINPEEQTVDFVVLFVPNEMIFSFIYEKMNEVWNEAFQKKVILAGPFSFTAILRTVFQSYRIFTYQKNVRVIVGLIQAFEKEYQKLSESLDTLGSRIESAQKQYREVVGTRDRQLTQVIDKIKHERGSDRPESIES